MGDAAGEPATAVSMEDDLPYHSLSDHLVHGVSGYDTTLDDEQRQRLREFREELQKPNAGAPAGEDEGEALTWDLIRTTKGAAESETTFLLRFMRARNFNVAAASKFIRADARWRLEVGAAPQPSPLSQMAAADVLGCDPADFHNVTARPRQVCFDKQGRPVVFSALRDLRCDDALKLVDAETFVRYHVWKQEQLMRLLHAQSVRLGKRVETIVAVLDLKGTSIRNTGGSFFKLVNAWTKVDSDHYPERMGTIFIINVPSVFSIVWKAIKPLLDPRTARKIQIHRKNYHDAVADVVGEENLPAGWRERGIAECLPERFSDFITSPMLSPEEEGVVAAAAPAAAEVAGAGEGKDAGAGAGAGAGEGAGASGGARAKSALQITVDDGARHVQFDTEQQKVLQLSALAARIAHVQRSVASANPSVEASGLGASIANFGDQFATSGLATEESTIETVRGGDSAGAGLAHAVGEPKLGTVTESLQGTAEALHTITGTAGGGSEDENRVIFSGWLVKRGHIRKSWKRRWFELSPRYLRYYRREARQGKPRKKRDELGCMELVSSESSGGHENRPVSTIGLDLLPSSDSRLRGREHVLEIATLMIDANANNVQASHNERRSRQVLLIQAASNDELLRWAAAIEAVLLLPAKRDRAQQALQSVEQLELNLQHIAAQRIQKQMRTRRSLREAAAATATEATAGAAAGGDGDGNGNGPVAGARMRALSFGLAVHTAVPYTRFECKRVQLPRSASQAEPKRSATATDSAPQGVHAGYGALARSEAEADTNEAAAAQSTLLNAADAGVRVTQQQSWALDGAVRLVEVHGEPCAFALTRDGSELIRLRAPTVEARQAWVALLEQACFAFGTGAASGSAPAAPRS
eukprot:g2561.t1